MIYLLYGEFVSEIDKFIDKVIKDNSILTKVSYNYKDTTIEEVINESSYTDLFGNKKIVILNECLFLTGKETLESDLLNKYIDDPNSDVYLVFKVITDKLDERKKLVKLLKSKAIIKYFPLLDNKNINSYIKSYFNDKGYTIDNISINEISNRLSQNSSVIDSELDKLYLYKINDKNITIDDVKKVICTYDNNKIFKLVESTIKNDKRSVFNLYKELLNDKEEPIVILSLLANQFRLIYQVKVLYNEGMNYKDIALKLKEHPYRVQLAYNNSINISYDKLKELLLELSDIDIKIKTGVISKEKGLELFFLEM